MEIHNNLEIVDLALKYKDILIVGDLQLGYEQYLNERGVLVPRFQTDDTFDRLSRILKKCKNIKKIIFNGDLKHEFGKISTQEWESTEKIIGNLSNKYEIIIIKGNHDAIVEPLVKRYKVKIAESYSVDDILFVHGDKVFLGDEKIIVISHEHPAISFKEKPTEKYKCFLKGKWNGHLLIVIPSFNSLTIGSDLRNKKTISPYLKGNLGKFEVYVVEDKIYYFGKLKNILK
jgi:uncharacterized protein